MCIIAAKPAGIPMPSAETIENMWYANPDGAGFMYADGNCVRIEKGFMKLADLTAALDKLAKERDLASLSMVLHFRITTHGGTCPENTHPFPLTDNVASMKKLRGKTKIGVAHNGIIPITPRSKDLSDTMEYIASQLAPLHRALPAFYKSKDAMLLISNAIRSKMVFLTPDGKLYTIGQFEQEDGILYSNTSYQSWYGSWRRGNWGLWDTNTKSWNSTALTKNLPGDWKNDDSLTTCASDEEYDNATSLRLMPLWAKDGVVRDPDGQLLDGDEFYLDKCGDLWWYSFEDDLAYYCGDGWSCCTSNGLPVHYDPEETELIWCVE